MKNLFGLIVVLLLAFSCSKKEPVKPADIKLTQEGGCSIKAKLPEDCDKGSLKLEEKKSNSLKKTDDFSEFKK